MLGGNLDVNVSPWAPGILFDVRTFVGHFRCTYSSQHFFRNELNPTINCLAAHFVRYIPWRYKCVLLRCCFSVMYNFTGLLCYNYTMTGLILIIYPGLCFVFGGPFTFSNEEDIFTLTVFPNGTMRRSVPYLTATLGRFCGVVTPPKTNCWNPKNTTKRLLFASLAKTGSIEIYHYKHHQFWKIDNIPYQRKSAELVSCTKTQRQEKPVRFSSNSLDGRTFRIVMATRLPATRLATSTRHHGDVLVLPGKTNMEPQKLVVSPFSRFSHCRLFQRLVVRVGSHFWQWWIFLVTWVRQTQKTKSHKALGGYSTSLV